MPARAPQAWTKELAKVFMGLNQGFTTRSSKVVVFFFFFTGPTGFRKTLALLLFMVLAQVYRKALCKYSGHRYYQDEALLDEGLGFVVV